MSPKRLDWDQGLAIGVVGIDDAHKELVDLYNQIAWACENDTTVADVRERIRSFMNYARLHFVEEEEWMRRVSYPGYVDHKADHERLLQDAGDFVESFGAALTERDGPAIATYFSYWLTRHIDIRDRKLKEFLDGDNGEAPI